MATTGPALFPGSGTFPGSTTYPGQGTQPQLEVLYSTDDAAVPTPTWSYAQHGLIPGAVRSFSTSRGRDSELGEIDAGTATIALDNRSRTFDPLNNALIRPFNRWWIREKFAGETQDIFKGYAESYDLQYPSIGKDAVSVVQCVDELKVLALSMPPLTDPPRDSYGGLIAFEDPDAYWELGDNAITFLQTETPTEDTTMEWTVEYPPPAKQNDPSLPSNKKRHDPRKGH